MEISLVHPVLKKMPQQRQLWIHNPFFSPKKRVMAGDDNPFFVAKKNGLLTIFKCEAPSHNAIFDGREPRTK